MTIHIQPLRGWVKSKAEKIVLTQMPAVISTFKVFKHLEGLKIDKSFIAGRPT